METNNKFSRWLIAIFSLSITIALSACSTPIGNTSSPSVLRTTTLIKNALVVDGTGRPGFYADVRFSKEKILSIGKLKFSQNDLVVDGSGFILAPGFIDSHSHHDIGLDIAPEAKAAISQGITTIVIGNDGSSSAPLSEIKKDLLNSPVALNIASYTGHGFIRSKAMGEDYKREATPDEINKMKMLLITDLENGSLGLSTGLEYDPGIYSSKKEVIELAKSVSKFKGRYISHMRSEDRAFAEALEELISIGKKADLPVQISHIKLAAIDLWGQSSSVIKRLEEARSEGVDVTADVYPYTYWESTLTVLLPERDYYDLDAARYALEKLAPAEGMTLSSYMPDPSLVGKNIAEIAIERKQSNEETYLQLIRDAYDGLSAEEEAKLMELPESVIGVSMNETDIENFIKWPHTNICSDGASTGHPRGFGSFTRAIRKYVREKNIIPIEEMIRKMTTLSAAHVGIEERGEIKEGFAADLVLFNLKTVSDRASIEQSDLVSDGIEGVWVNGTRVWNNKQTVGNLPGVFINRANLR